MYTIDYIIIIFETRFETESAAEAKAKRKKTHNRYAVTLKLTIENEM